jgi:hypothetical protein
MTAANKHAYSWKEHFYSQKPIWNKNRFFVRIQDAILNNGFEAVGIFGAKGLGKSTLSAQVMKQIYGSHELAREFRITRRDELPVLVDKVRNDSRYWIKYGDTYLKRVPAINWDDIAVDMPSTEGNQKDFVMWHKYFQTIRSHVAVLFGTFPDWSDFRRRMKVSFTGEICLTWQTRRLANGVVVKRRKGEMLWFRNLPDYRKRYVNLEGKEQSIPIKWSNLPKKALQTEIDERTHLADRLLINVRDSARTKARVLCGLTGSPDQSLLEYQLEMLGTIKKAIDPRPVKEVNIQTINKEYEKQFGMKIKPYDMNRYLTELDAKEVIIFRREMQRRGTITLTDLGIEVLKLRVVGNDRRGGTGN